MIKFVGFYVTAEWVYEQLDSKFGLKKSEMPTSQQLMVTFASGYWAGIFCAIATQPMDNLVSMKVRPSHGTAGGRGGEGKGWEVWRGGENREEEG
jgi:solute carrier family 25 phosphate transporter 3